MRTRSTQRGTEIARGVDVDMLYRRYHRAAFHWAWAILKNEDDARDAVQDAFIKVTRHKDRFEAKASAHSWLYRIVTNVCLDNLRSRRHKMDLQPSLETEPAPTNATFQPAEAYAARELGEKLVSGIDQLSEDHQTVIVMRELEGLTYDEMAKGCDCPKGTIMSRLFHARRKLRRILGDGLDPNGAIAA